MTPLDPTETMRRFEAAVTEARAFFGIDPAWKTPVTADSDGGAEIRCHVGYLDAPIKINLDFFQKNPERIREYASHEVAHILSAEVNRLRSVLPPEYRDTDTPAGRMFDDALECLTVRLEHLFLRERSEAPSRLAQSIAGSLSVAEHPVTAERVQGQIASRALEETL